MLLYRSDEGYRFLVSVCWEVTVSVVTFGSVVCVCVRRLQTLARSYTDILPFDPLVSYHWSSPTYSARGETWSPNKKLRREKGENQRNGTVFTTDTFLSPYLKPAISIALSQFYIHTLNLSLAALYCMLHMTQLLKVIFAKKKTQKCCSEIKKVLSVCMSMLCTKLFLKRIHTLLNWLVYVLLNHRQALYSMIFTLWLLGDRSVIRANIRGVAIIVRVLLLHKCTSTLSNFLACTHTRTPSEWQ